MGQIVFNRTVVSNLHISKVGSFFALVDRKMSQAQTFSPFLVDPLGAYKTAKKGAILSEIHRVICG